jgi:glycosyltransferase involved in cell wall biosynthesis
MRQHSNNNCQLQTANSELPSHSDGLISIVIPIYNEREAIVLLFTKIREVMDRLANPYEVIFVNDGSHDGSAEVLDQLASTYPQVKIIHFRRNFGQTAAMMAGFDYASGEIIIPMDGDYQNDPEDIPRMLAKLDEGYDVCSGWRRDRQDNALQRNIPSMMANKLISFISGVQLHDFGCSLKAYRREVIEGVRLYGEMHRFLPIYTKWHGARITELPVNHFARRTGQSKYGLERVLKVILDLMVVKFLDRHAQKPMYVFGACGLLSLAASFGFSLWAILLLIFANKPLITTPLPLMSVFTFLMGVMSFLMGLLAEMITRTFYESQGKSIYLVRGTRNLFKKL